MLWIKKNISGGDKKPYLPYPYRFCNVHISDKYKQILFVPFGETEKGFHVEINNIIIDTWPCKFENLQSNIVEALNRYSPHAEYEKGKWPAYDCSKAKSQHSFETDYIKIRLETDLSRGYGDKEAERIKISARPTALDNRYSLNGQGHLIDTNVAQIVLDIFEACLKIRS